MRLSRSTVKIERPRNLQKLLERSLETGDAGPLKAALAQTPPAEVQSFLSTVDAQKRRDVEKLLGTEALPAGLRPLETGAVTGGRRVHDVRALKQQPWWGAVKADPLPALLHPEPTKDVEVHGERFTKDDVASMLRSVAR